MAKVKQYTGNSNTNTKTNKPSVKKVKKGKISKSQQAQAAIDVVTTSTAANGADSDTEAVDSAWSPVEREEEDTGARARKWAEIWENARRLDEERMERYRQRGQELKKIVANLCKALTVAESALQQYKSKTRYLAK